MFAKLFERDGQQVLVRRGTHEGRPAMHVTFNLDDGLIATTHMSVNDGSLLQLLLDKMTEEDAFLSTDKIRKSFSWGKRGKKRPAFVPFARLFEDDGGQIAVWLCDDDDYGELAIWVVWEDGTSIITTNASYRSEHHRMHDWQGITTAEAARAYAKEIGR